MVASHKTEISQMRGLGRKMPITFVCFLIGALSIIGLPPFGGVWSKWYLSLGAAETEQIIFIAVFMISSLLNIAYLVPIVIRGFFSEPDIHVDNEDHPIAHNPDTNSVSDASGPSQWRVRGLEEAPLMCVGALMATALGCLVLFFYANSIYHFLLPLANGDV